jgi:hypothetical protein
MTAVPDKSLTPTSIRLFREALECSENASRLSCGFDFCPGPDARYVPMATCNVCRTTQLLRLICIRFDDKS